MQASRTVHASSFRLYRTTNVATTGSSRRLFSSTSMYMSNIPAWPHSSDFGRHRIVDVPYVHHQGEVNYLVTEHKISCPLDPSASVGETEDIDIHATVVDRLRPNTSSDSVLAYLRHSKVGPSMASSYIEMFQTRDSVPSSLLYFQGGPGFSSPRPGSSLPLANSWAEGAFSRGIERLVLLDQRGTGGSELINRQVLKRKFPRCFEDREAEGYDDGINTIYCARK